MHYAVLVASNDVDTELAPFHQFECTGIEDEYVVDIDVTQEYATIKELEDENIPIASAEAMVKVHRSPEFKYGYAIVDGETIIKVVRRTNPNDKWDYYNVGGRWEGLLVLKSGVAPINEAKLENGRARVDQAKKSDVDFNFMLQSETSTLMSQYDSLKQCTKGAKWRTWEEVLSDNSHDHDKARDAYRSQPGVAEIRAHKEYSMLDNIDDYLMERSEYERCIMRRPLTYSILFKGRWIDRPHSKFGSTEYKSWCDKYWSTVDSIPADMILTIVDIHI